MIKLLRPHSLEVRNQFRAEKFQMTLNERQSTAVITIGQEAPVISVGDWVQDERDPGAGIVWRVKSVAEDYATNTRTVTCEHLAATLRDTIVFGEVAPGDMNPTNPKSKTCTAKQAISFLLKKSDDWLIGTFGFEPYTAPYSFNSENLFSALETVSGSLKDAWWSYDFSRYPFRLNVNPAATAVSCEMRMSRNITTMRQTVDMSRMYTRFYPIGKDNLKLPGKGYIEKNTKAYGVICRTETDQEMDSERKLTDWANERLNTHAEPSVTVTISGLDLSAATGEDLDRLTLGRMCRVPLPDQGVTITERITQLSWSDKAADPENVTITLANRQEDVASIINRLAKSAGGGARAAAKNGEEKHAWIIDQNDHVGLLAEAVGGEGADKDWSKVASIMVDGEGIHQRVVKTVGDVEAMGTDLELAEDKISMVVDSNGIRAGEICLAINDSGESTATISANKIYLLGQTIANTITADLLQTKVSLIQNLRVNALTTAGSLKFESGDGTTITGSQAADIVRNLKIVSSGNTYTLQKITCGDPNWTDVGSFSRAVSSWTWGGGSGKINVTALPQNQMKSVNVSVGGPGTISANGTYTYKAYYENSDGDDVETGASMSVTVSVAPTKAQITCSRGNVLINQPSTDGTITAITANGWYVLTVAAAGTTKTYKLHVTV